MEIAMGEVAQFPEVQYFLICHECEETEWFICWPKDKRPEWYIECVGRGFPAREVIQKVLLEKFKHRSGPL